MDARDATDPLGGLKGGQGFTLLEVLVASAILGLVLAALYSVFSRTLASKGLVEERAARARIARITLLRIGEDLQAAFLPATGRFRFTAETRRAGTFPEDALSFVAFVPSPLTSASPTGDLCEIGYALVPDPVMPTHRQLVRRVTSDLGVADPRVADPAADRSVAGDVYPLLARVRGLRFRFFDGRNWREGWGQDNTQDKLPRAVEVVLYLDDPREEVVAFSTVIDLPLADARRTGVS